MLDPPEDFFRVRMVIILLETCGHYFDRGSSKKRLDQFLIHFQRYILSKGPLPLDIEFDLQVSFLLFCVYFHEGHRVRYFVEVDSIFIKLCLNAGFICQFETQYDPLRDY